MNYYENPDWIPFYEELDDKKRKEIYDRLVMEVEDDGANALRKELLDWRYTDPKHPGKRTDKGIWEMVVMPAHMSGFFAIKSKIQAHIRDSLRSLRITEENLEDEILKSAVYWEIRNIAKRFYDTCKSSKYGRKLFGMQESNWKEKQVRCSHDVWIMAEQVPERFDMQEEMKVFSDAVIDEFACLSTESKEIYEEVRVKMRRRKFPIVI